MREKNIVQQAILEMIAIIISVLLALFLNNWWQDQQTSANHAKTLLLIETELEANRQELVEAVAYYKRKSPEVGAALEDGVTTEEAKEIMEDCCELMSSGSGRTSHEMAIITGLYASIDPNTAADIIAAFVGQEDLKAISDSLTNGLMTTVDLNDPEAFLRYYYIFMMTMTPSLEELLEVTDTALTTIGSLTTEADAPLPSE